MPPDPQNPGAATAQPQTRILLGGGGSADDEHPIFERFAAWIGDGRVLYLPIAADQPGSTHLAWVVSILTPLGVHHVDMWTSLAGHQAAELATYAGIFIGGGNASGSSTRCAARVSSTRSASLRSRAASSTAAALAPSYWERTSAPAPTWIVTR